MCFAVHIVILSKSSTFSPNPIFIGDWINIVNTRLQDKIVCETMGEKNNKMCMCVCVCGVDSYILIAKYWEKKKRLGNSYSMYETFKQTINIEKRKQNERYNISHYVNEYKSKSKSKYIESMKHSMRTTALRYQTLIRRTKNFFTNISIKINHHDGW